MAHPSHDDLAGYLRCVVHDLFVLALATEAMIKESGHGLSQVNKTAALVKLRAIYDFFHRPSAMDSIKVAMFDRYSPQRPSPVRTEWNTWLTLQSINTYVVHLDIERVTKVYPQPKFKRGERAVLRTAVQFMKDAQKFVASVMEHPESVKLNDRGMHWWKEFNDALPRLDRLLAPDDNT
jgi:hypothetical protein